MSISIFFTYEETSEALYLDLPSEISRYCGLVENFYLDFLSVYIEILQIKTLF